MAEKACIINEKGEWTGCVLMEGCYYEDSQVNHSEFENIPLGTLIPKINDVIKFLHNIPGNHYIVYDENDWRHDSLQLDAPCALLVWHEILDIAQKHPTYTIRWV